jgi:hypothetical protein
MGSFRSHRNSQVSFYQMNWRENETLKWPLSCVSFSSNSAWTVPQNQCSFCYVHKMNAFRYLPVTALSVNIAIYVCSMSSLLCKWDTRTSQVFIPSSSSVACLKIRRPDHYSGLQVLHGMWVMIPVDRVQTLHPVTCLSHLTDLWRYNF